MPLRYVRELTAAERAALTELYKSSPVAAVVRLVTPSCSRPMAGPYPRSLACYG